MAAASKVEVSDGENSIEKPLKDILASMLWEAALTGQVRFVAPDEDSEQRSIALSFEQWESVTQFVFSQIDGASPIPVDLTSKGKELTMLTADKLAAADKAAAVELGDWESERFGKAGDED